MIPSRILRRVSGWVAIVATLAWLSTEPFTSVARAQTPDLTGVILDGIQKAGAFAAVVLFAMYYEMRTRWREEREERTERDKERAGLLERVIDALNNASRSVSDLTETTTRAVDAAETVANLLRERFPPAGR